MNADERRALLDSRDEATTGPYRPEHVRGTWAVTARPVAGRPPVVVATADDDEQGRRNAAWLVGAANAVSPFIDALADAEMRLASAEEALADAEGTRALAEAERDHLAVALDVVRAERDQLAGEAERLRHFARTVITVHGAEGVR